MTIFLAFLADAIRTLALALFTFATPVVTAPAPASVETTAPVVAPDAPQETDSVPTEEVPSPSTEATPPSEAPATAYDNWMEELLPSVDPQGLAVWHFYRNGAWGASDGVNVYIDPDSPVEYHYSIMVHELGHVLQQRFYGDMWLAPNIEAGADCIALALGATWINYGCDDPEEAQRVLAGQ